MSEEPIFEQLGNLLLERLRGEMVPAVLHQKDDIKLTHPGAETDYRFGVFLHDMEEGLDEEARKRTLHITDRRQAIRTAATLAGKGSVILIAGKGHEDYQEIKGVKHHFDDREVIMEIIADEK